MVRQCYWEHLDKGIPETRPTSHPFAPYLSSRAKSFHNWRHKLLGVSVASLSKERTFFWNGLLHRPCAQEYPNALCMVNDVCKKRYLRVFFEETTQGEDGYLVYCRQNDGQMFWKTLNGFAYDNWWVVPHNPYLTKMFNAHINVEVSINI